MSGSHKLLLALAGMILAGVSVAAIPVLAQTPAPVPAALPKPSLIKVVNLVEVFNKMDMKIEGDNEIRDLGKKLDNDRKTLEGELEALKKEAAFYTDQNDEYRAVEEKMLRKASEISAQADFIERRLLMEQRLKTIQIYRALLKGIEDYAKANGIALVMMTDTPDLVGARSQQELLSKISLKKVVYAHESMDITRELIVKLNTDFQREKSRKPAE